jgi:hypothetical protein
MPKGRAMAAIARLGLAGGEMTGEDFAAWPRDHTVPG